MPLPDAFLEQYDEPFGFMDFAAIGAVSIPARRRLAEAAEAMAGAGGQLIPLVFEQIDKVTDLAAELVGAAADRVVIVPNTSVGLFSVAFGLPGGSVVVPETDFAANLYPWVRAGEAGRIEPKTIAVPHGRLTADLIAGAVDSSTTAAAVSLVDYRTGYRCDLAALREAAGNALLVVDAVQAVGALQVTMEHADVLVAGGHKWLRAGGGIGFMALSDRALDRLAPSLVGWPGVQDPFDTEAPLPHPPADGARRFMMGSPPFTAAGALLGALEALGGAGIDQIEAAVTARSRAVEDEARRSGAEVMAPWRSGSERSGIVSFRPRGKAAEVHRRLAEEGFYLTERGGWLRAAPHASTDSEAPAALGEALRRFDAPRRRIGIKRSSGGRSPSGPPGGRRLRDRLRRLLRLLRRPPRAPNPEEAPEGSRRPPR